MSATSGSNLPINVSSGLIYNPYNAAITIGGNVSLTGIDQGIVFSDGSFQTTAGGTYAITPVTSATYLAVVSDRLLAVSYTAIGSVTVVLPNTADTALGAELIIKDTGGNAVLNPIIINGYGSDTIDGESTVTITANYNSYTLVYTGSNNWSVI